MSRPEGYLDIVWRQFKKNRLAYWALWLLVPIFLVAIFAPALASHHPFVLSTPDGVISPWWVMLFHTEREVDFVFNMAMLGFFPWVAAAIATSVVGRRRSHSGAWRLKWILIEALAILLLLVGLFRGPEWFRLDGPAPSIGKLQEREITREHFNSPGEIDGWYPLIPFDPIASDVELKNQPPLTKKPEELWIRINDQYTHWLGTETSGRDVLSSMIHGTRISMTVGFVAVSLYLTIGILLGSIAGYFGGWWDAIISRVIEIVVLFPSFFLILTLVGLLKPSVYIPMVVIGLTGWTGVARLTRGEVLKQRSLDYTMAAQALGASNFRIVFRHILPNSLAPALVAAPFGIASAITTEAGLSVLGFGVQPPAPTWGTLLKLATENYALWWLVIWPSAAIFVTVTVFNLVGGGLRDAMDPRLRI